MKILFCNLPAYDTDGRWHGVRSGCRWPCTNPGGLDECKGRLQERIDGNFNLFPFFMAFGAAIYKKQGHNAKVYDALALCHTYKQFFEHIKEEKPDKVIIETSHYSYEQDIYITQCLKEMGFYTIIYGIPVRVKKDELSKMKFIDEVWDGNPLIIIGGENYIDDLPMPLRDKETIFMYNDYFAFHEKTWYKPQIQTWTSIGCSYNCTFCVWRWCLTDGKYKVRKVENIKEEVAYYIKEFGIKSILFDDDTFNIGDKRTIEISKMMSEFKLQWGAMVRADTCSIKAFQEMYKGGCRLLRVGVESFSPAVLKKINKGLEADDLLKRLIELIDIGFIVYMTTMQFIPGETPTDREISNQLIEELHRCGVRYQKPYCIALPGTPMYKKFRDFEIKHYGPEPEDWFEYGDYYNPVLMEKLREFSKEEK